MPISSLVVGLSLLADAATDTPACRLEIPGYKTAWLSVREVDSQGVLHGEILGRKDSKRAAVVRILPHLALTWEARSRWCRGPARDVAMYPEEYQFDRWAWDLFAIDSSGWLCRGSLLGCMDSTRLFRTRAHTHWQEVRDCNPLRLRVLHCLREGCRLEALFQEQGLGTDRVDSVLSHRCTHP